MKHGSSAERSLIFLLFIILVFAGCQKKAQGPHHFIKLQAEGNPPQSLFDSALMVLSQRLNIAYNGDITVRADGKTIVLEVAGRPNLDSLAVLVLSKGGFGMYEMYNNNEVAIATPGTNAVTPGSAELIYAAASDTARVRKQFLERNPSLYNAMFIWGPANEFEHAFPLYALKRSATGKPVISKMMIHTATPGYDQMGRPNVSILLKQDYAATWLKATRDNIGRSIAIKFGNLVLSAPRVAGEIPGGNMEISGHFTALQTKMLSAMIATPDLTAALQISHVDTALFVPLRGYPTLKQQARYELIQTEFLRLRPQIDSVLIGSGPEVVMARQEMERIYHQDINTMAAETRATRAEVDEFITNIEGVLNGLKRRLSGEADETDPESLKRMLEAIPTQ